MLISRKKKKENFERIKVTVQWLAPLVCCRTRETLRIKYNKLNHAGGLWMFTDLGYCGYHE